jgi:hypothetical protein
MFLIITVSMAVGFVYNTNTVITLVYEYVYVSVSADLLVMSVCIVLCLQLQDILGLVAQSVKRLATGWTVRGSIPVGARFPAPVQYGPGAHPASCTVGTRSFRGGGRERTGRDADPSTPSSSVV